MLSITAVLAVATLTACGGSDDDDPAAATPSDDATIAAADLATADTSLGTVVVDGTGMTAYYFTKDTKDSGASACSGDCATAWPAIESASDTPTVDGVTGTVGVIPAADGGHQITIDGMPIYTFAKDTTPGDVLGQGVNGVWWVIAPDGAQIGG
jgi:predicted lipoprotein with Yx(FWY)xxD motif